MADQQTTSFDSTKQKLASDFRGLISNAEELLRTTANYSGEGVAAARAKFEEKLTHVKATLSDAQEVALDSAKQAASAAEDYVQENPWRAVGIAVAIGVLIGFLTTRTR